MKRLSVLAIVLSLAAAPLPARTAPTAEHAAECVAALQVEAERLAKLFRDGNADVERELVHRVEQGFAFIGAAYKLGLPEGEADRLLKAAQKAQTGLPASELAARQATCASEGTELLKKANVLERAFVSGAAQRRVDKLKRAG